MDMNVLVSTDLCLPDIMLSSLQIFCIGLDLVFTFFYQYYIVSKSVTDD